MWAMQKGSGLRNPDPFSAFPLFTQGVSDPWTALLFRLHPSQAHVEGEVEIPFSLRVSPGSQQVVVDQTRGAYVVGLAVLDRR